jgi:hypothetical protein
MKILFPAALTGILAAADLEVSVEIPRLTVAEYHKPYLAMWVERPDQSVAANLTVWYDQQTNKNEKGTTWLKDLRHGGESRAGNLLCPWTAFPVPRGHPARISYFPRCAHAAGRLAQVLINS